MGGIFFSIAGYRVPVSGAYCAEVVRVLFHLPEKDVTTLNDIPSTLPEGVRYFLCYVLALREYLRGEYGKAEGIAAAALAINENRYPIPAIYVRMNVSEKAFRVKPEEYDIAVFCRQVFSMYDGELCKVELKCKNALMKTVIDRFGEDVETMSLESGYFKAVVEVSVSPTFYSWVFTFDGGIKILSPKKVRQSYIDRLKSAENHA